MPGDMPISSGEIGPLTGTFVLTAGDVPSNPHGDLPLSGDRAGHGDPKTLHQQLQ